MYSNLALNSFAIDGNQLANMGFSLVITVISKFNLNILFNYNANAFTKIQVNFIIANRNDITFGFYMYIASSSQFVIPVLLPTLSNVNTTIARVFINGFQYNQNSPQIRNDLNISLTVKSIAQQAMTLLLDGSTITSNQIKQIWFSYLLFSPS